MKKAPWKDYQGKDIVEGSVISHPSGQQGTVVFDSTRLRVEDQWLVDYGSEIKSRLVLQIGARGQAMRI